MAKIKPKEVLINVPIVLMFDDLNEISEFASNVNQILHGKVRFKFEELGMLANQYVGIFYLQRNNEFQELRDEFVNAIEEEEMAKYGAP